MNHQSSSARRRLYPDRLGVIQLYWSSAVMSDTISRCRALGWKVVEVDVSEWHDSDRLHDDLAAALTLPEYYGRNLDALLDVLRGIADGSVGPADDPGMALVLHSIEKLAERDRKRLEVLLDLFADAALYGLHHGWPLAILARSTDAGLTVGPVGALAVDWNPAERQRSRRA